VLVVVGTISSDEIVSLASEDVVSDDVVSDDVVDGSAVEDHVTVEVTTEVAMEIVTVGTVCRVCTVCTVGSVCRERPSCLIPRLPVAFGSHAATDGCASTAFAGSTVRGDAAV
jgi:hypothetical protein